MNGPPIKDRARNRWTSILPALGIDRKFLVNRHGPCPICGEGKDRFRFDDKDGSGSFYCTKCGAGDGVKLVMLKQGLEYGDAVREVEKCLGSAPAEQPKGAGRTPEQKRETLKRLWGSTEPAHIGNPAGAYLFGRTGLTICDPKVLRYAPRCAYRDGATTTFHPALLALVMDAAGVPVNIHRTYLAEDGTKADLPEPKRTMEGTLPPGCAVRLGRYVPGRDIGVAEGIETALSARRLFGVQTWSTLNSNRLQTWKPPEGVGRIWIMGDNDASFDGQAAAYALAKRLRHEKFEVEVAIPVELGHDWNDVLADHMEKEAA